MKVALAIVLTACGVFGLAHISTASADNRDPSRTYAANDDYYASANWNGVKATMQIKSGTCEDYVNQGWIGEVLWAVHGTPQSKPDYLEIGYRRGFFSSDYQDALSAYWEETVSGQGLSVHRVTTALTAGDSDEFKIVWCANTNWKFYLNGSAAKDANGIYETTQGTGYTTVTDIDFGMETNCTLCRLGTAADPVDISVVQKTSGGISGSWSYAPFYANKLNQWSNDDSGYTNHLNDVSPGQYITNYRNIN